MAKIMLVEDDNNLREIYEARLMAEGYEIVTARDGEEALAVAVKERPDLIISDVMMPKISGFDMLDILRSTPETKHAKVIMMTALSQAEDKERASKLGADRYLVKSQVTLEDVAKVAREVLEGPATPVADQAAAPAVAPAPAATPAPAVAPTTEPAAAPVPVTEPATQQPLAPAAQTSPATANADSGTSIPVNVVSSNSPSTTAAPSTDQAAAPAVAPATMATPVPTDSASAGPSTIPASVPEPTTSSNSNVQSETNGVTGGITDLTNVASSAETNASVEEKPTAESQVAPTASVWSADSLNEQTAKPNADVARAEAELSGTGVQSLEDEEAAIAKQIESALATPNTESNDEPSSSTQETVNEPAQPSMPETAQPPATTQPAPEENMPANEQPAATATKTSAGQKVIQPISDISKPASPSLEELAKKEEELEQARAAATTQPAPASADNPLTPPVAESSEDPNAMAL